MPETPRQNNLDPNINAINQRLDKLTLNVSNLVNAMTKKQTGASTYDPFSRLAQLPRNFSESKLIIDKFYDELFKLLQDNLNNIEIDIPDSLAIKSYIARKNVERDLNDLSTDSINEYRELLKEFGTSDYFEREEETSQYIERTLKKLEEDKKLEKQAIEEIEQYRQDAELAKQQETEELIKRLEEKRYHALSIARENFLRQSSIQEKLYRIQEAEQEYEEKIKLFDALREAEGKLTDEQKEEYKKLVEDKLKEDLKYIAIRKQLLKELSKEERVRRYKDELLNIKEEAKAQRALNNEENKEDTEAHKKREQEINRKEKRDINEALQIYGITNLAATTMQSKSVLQGLSTMISSGGAGGTDLVVSMLTETLGGSSPIAMAITAGVKILSTMSKVLNFINQRVAQGVTQAASAESTYLAPINARLYKMIGDNTNYYTQMTEWGSENGQFGLAIQSWNSVVDRQKYIEQLNSLVQAGIAYNAEERALLSTISDKLVTTFDVMDLSLTRLVKLQQTDLTVSALGSEALLTQFLNRFSADNGLPDTSYLTDMYDSVSDILLDALSKLSADLATAFGYEVQKWLGAMYSLGLSSQGVTQLAQGISYLQTGNVQDLTSNQQLQYIYAAAAERAGLSLGDILIEGLDVDTTNKLLENVVLLLQDIYNNSSSNAILSAWTNISGMSISDLKAMTNISQDYLASISTEHQNLVSAFEEANNQISLIASSTRTSMAEAILNIINNTVFSVGKSLIEDQLSSNRNLETTNVSGNDVAGYSVSGALFDLLGIGGLSKYTVYQLASSVGGTMGTLLQSFIAIPTVIQELKKFNEQQKIASSNTVSFAKDRQWVERLGDLSSIMATYFTEYAAENIVARTSDNISESMEIKNWQQAALTNQVEELLIKRSPWLQSTPDRITASEINEITNSIDELSTSINDNAVSLSDTVDTLNNNVNSQVATFESQAKQIAATQVSIANQSLEDSELLKKENDISSYLFENENLIRISLAEVEDEAATTLKNYVHADEMEEMVRQILSYVSTKINVDLIDNDVNTIIHNIYLTKWNG